MSSNAVSDFLPSTNGLKFVNSWPSEPDIVVSVPEIGDVHIGNASNGLCGGMAFAVRDFFEAKLPVVADTETPSQGSPLFTYIVARLFDSFNLPDGVLKYFRWMNTPDGDTGIWVATLRGVAWMTIIEELPNIKADIDAGHPSALGLVTIHTTDPTLLGRNHQVLAYAYSQDDAGNLQLKICDPNTGAADADGVVISLNVSDPTKVTPITHNVGISDPIRGFFRIVYTADDPSGLEPSATPAVPHTSS